MTMNAGAWYWMAIWMVALLAIVWLLVSGGPGDRQATPVKNLRGRSAADQISEYVFRHERDVLEIGEQHT